MEVRKRVFRLKRNPNAPEPYQLPPGFTITLLYETPLPSACPPPPRERTAAEAIWDDVQEWFAARGQPVPDDERDACLAEIAAEAERLAHPPPLSPPPPKPSKPRKKKTPTKH